MYFLPTKSKDPVAQPSPTKSSETVVTSTKLLSENSITPLKFSGENYSQWLLLVESRLNVHKLLKKLETESSEISMNQSLHIVDFFINTVDATIFKAEQIDLKTMSVQLVWKRLQAFGQSKIKESSDKVRIHK